MANKNSPSGSPSGSGARVCRGEIPKCNTLNQGIHLSLELTIVEILRLFLLPFLPDSKNKPWKLTRSFCAPSWPLSIVPEGLSTSGYSLKQQLWIMTLALYLHMYLKANNRTEKHYMAFAWTHKLIKRASYPHHLPKNFISFSLIL